MRTIIASVFMFLMLLPGAAYSLMTGDYVVRDVIDGDTIVLINGEKVRYIGIDTPEINEPFYYDARIRNMAMVLGRRVRVEVCGMEPFDKYGRTLAWVYSGGKLVNAELLKEGLAKTLVIPPCGVPKAAEFDRLEAEARSRKLGIWSDVVTGTRPVVTPELADRYMGQTVRLRGRVDRVMPGPKSWFLEFGSFNGFKAVVMPNALLDLQRQGKDIFGFRGKDIIITGVVTEHNGRPEILIDAASRIEEP